MHLHRLICRAVRGRDVVGLSRGGVEREDGLRHRPDRLRRYRVDLRCRAADGLRGGSGLRTASRREPGDGHARCPDLAPRSASHGAVRHVARGNAARGADYPIVRSRPAAAGHSLARAGSAG